MTIKQLSYFNKSKLYYQAKQAVLCIFINILIKPLKIRTPLFPNYCLKMLFILKHDTIQVMIKKVLFLQLILCITIMQVSAINFGMYKPEEDYGLIDGFKLNASKKDRAEGKQLIELKTEIPEEKARLEKEKASYEANKDQKADDEYQMFKFMLEDTIPF